MTAGCVFTTAQTYDKNQYIPFLRGNKDASTGLPHSYYVPNGYYASIPDNLKPHNAVGPKKVPQCNNEVVSAAKQDLYEFQTEQYLASLGINIYDAAVRGVALTLAGYYGEAESYYKGTLLAHKTLQFNDIKGDAPCKGVVTTGQCSDPHSAGACGMCYGDGPTNADRSLSVNNAYFFRMVGDYWSLQGTLDARCPELNKPWTWNDYRPVLGENAWANLLGVLQSEYLNSNQDPSQVKDSSTAMQLAIAILPALQAMQIDGLGAIYYAPRNTFDVHNPDIGSTFSTENQGSTLAGLKALQFILTNSTTTQHKDKLPVVAKLIAGIEQYFQKAYLPARGYFSQGGSWNAKTKTPTWAKEPYFATDCQTWITAVLGADKIDSWFGSEAALSIWNTTKRIAGVNFDNSTGLVDGVGYTDNTADQILSGEWTLGAVNMVKNLASYYPSHSASLLAEAAHMRAQVESQLKMASPYGPSLQYANKRYFIPFGWWANPIPATASAAWAVLEDYNYNVFKLGGEYNAVYSL